MKTIKQVVAINFISLILFSCSKGDWEFGDTPLFNFPEPAYSPGIPSKKLKVKVLDGDTKLGVKDAVYYVNAMGRKINCMVTPCDSILYEDSVITDADGNALITKRGNIENLRPVKGYWQLTQQMHTYSSVDFDSTVLKLWPEVWVKIRIKNTTRYDSGYLFSPRLECVGLKTAYQPVIAINKDTTIVERLWANQDYKISLRLLKGSIGAIYPINPGETVLKEFNQFIGKDTTELILSY